MSTRLRWYRPHRIYEITTRTIQERFLLRPGRASRELVLGVIARALVVHPGIRLYAFTFLSNHYHMLASSDDGGSLARFLDHVNGNIARELGRLHGWRGRFWQRRASAIEVVDDDALVARLRYVIGQGLKEGLVASALDWSGASSTPVLAGGAPLQGVWVHRDRETRALRRGRPLPPDRYRETLPVPLTPIPPWADLAPDALVDRQRALIADVEDEAARARTYAPAGIRQVEAQDPHDRPTHSEHRPAPLCHATTARSRNIYRAAYRAFVDAFRRAADAIRTTSHTLFAGFPPASHPRPPTYLPVGASTFASASDH